jgi:hypothetical protein
MWNLWARGSVERKVELARPFLAIWEKSTHPAQVRLQSCLDSA